MSEIRLLKKHEFEEFVNIVINAYPGVMEHTLEFRQKLINSYIDIQKNVDTVDFYGLFREGKLVGGMRLHLFNCTFRGNMIKVGGIGSVAVDLLHKKEKIAKELIEEFIRIFQEKNIPILSLYPFRPDFYLNMGFGYGTKMNQYQFSPLALPTSGDKRFIDYVKAVDGHLLLDCYNTFAENNHGMFFKEEHDIKKWFSDTSKRLVGFYKEGKIDSYLRFSFKKLSETNFCFNALVIDEWVYNSREGFLGICSFLHSQADQVDRIIFNTQDEFFYHVLSDPRNHTNEMLPSVYHESNTSGVGLMYRINDVKKILQNIEGPYLGDLSFAIKLNVHDCFVKEGSQTVYLHIEKGFLKVKEDSSFVVEVSINIADFSSLMMSSIDFQSLYRYGKINVSSEKYIPYISNLFSYHSKPICMTAF